jgi:hypothetical protein
MRMENAYEVALANREKGIVSIPCKPGTKHPLVRWKRWQNEMPSVELLESWFKGTRNNIAILTSGMVVFDCDDPAKADLVLEKCGPTSHRLRTPRSGVHLGYRKRKGVDVKNLVKIKGLPIDIRTDGGLEMVPPSVTEEGVYEWLGEGLRPVSELPVAKVSWTRTRTRRKVQEQVVSPDATFMELRAQKWLEKVEGAISGQRGHSATFRVACKLTHYFGLGEEAAVRLLLEVFNPKCEPEWSEGEMRHKVADALKKVHRR